MNLVFGFILKNNEDGGFRFFTHTNITLLVRSQLVCTRDDLTKLKDILNTTDVIELCTKKKSTKWRFYRLKNLTVFAALLKDVTMGWKDAVLPELLLRSGTITCLNFEENTRQPYNNNLCLSRSIALHLHGSQRLEVKTAKIFNFFFKRKNGFCLNQFQGAHMNNILVVKDLLTTNILLYDIDTVHRIIIGGLVIRCVQKNENTVQLFRDNNNIRYVSNMNAVL